jgi:Mn-dependent DtxR family transcriptional regulator
MSSTEDKVLEIIWDFGGEASVSTITREARITPDYARLICRDLLRNGYIDFSNFKVCYLKNKGRLAAAKMKVSGSEKRKVVIPEKPNKFGLGKNKKGWLRLDY